MITSEIEYRLAADEPPRHVCPPGQTDAQVAMRAAAERAARRAMTFTDGSR